MPHILHHVRVHRLCWCLLLPSRQDAARVQPTCPASSCFDVWTHLRRICHSGHVIILLFRATGPPFDLENVSLLKRWRSCSDEQQMSSRSTFKVCCREEQNPVCNRFETWASAEHGKQSILSCNVWRLQMAKQWSLEAGFHCEPIVWWEIQQMPALTISCVQFLFLSNKCAFKYH